ncbi:MAG: hypothetical protein OJF59_000129 [Cytophagales bacterium]|jgi:hypothetical protein|nr:hypothetical protein [Bacteroidota bacterium]MBS1982149.1 hypothetical protein [Bacteroidota bacterium]WHZ06376.1 MAG: hypothetical protein OJF59_000129 [Cytophagales bacterium]
MKSIIISILFALLTANLFAQKQSFDIVSYTAPTDWTLKQGNDNVSYSRIDGASWAQIAIYQHRNCEGDIQTDFVKDWNELVAANKTISSPEKTEPKTAEGWTVMSGSGVWQYNGANVASVLTVYSNNTICVAVLCNATAQPYLKDYQSLIGSLDIDANGISDVSGSVTASTGNNNAIVGIWANNLLETSGYSNGYPQYTAGYFRKEYTFKSDGTYSYFNKIWSAYSKPILYIYETGNWSVSGNKLTISPTKARSEEWSKASSNRNNEWGTVIKSKDAKLEKITYTFEIKTYSGSQSTALLLTSDKPTERDGTSNNNGGLQTYSYAWRKEALIDFSPGFKINAANQSSLPSSKPQQVNSSQVSNNVASPLAGKTFEGTTAEKSGYGNSQYLTGGYWAWQYQFNKDGTYRFVYVAASHFNEVKLLQYETGTYSVNGDQLTISPAKGANEEWSKVGKTSNGNSDVSNRTINDTWNKKLKTATRNLEKVTYPFSIQYLDANKANTLILQHASKTERDGSPGWDDSSYYYETTPEKSRMAFPEGF